MTFTFRPANRSQAKPLIGLHSESGAGKTYSSILLARGFVGTSGKTESGRGEAYADPKEYPEIGGYQVLSLRDDFSPKSYGRAIDAAEKAGLDALIIDSASHEWEGIGGVLSMAADNEAAGKKGPIVWQKPKIDHQREFMLRFMQTSIPLVILNMRSKYPMLNGVNPENGKKEWYRSKELEPKQSEDILYEMFVHGWIEKETHAFKRTKCTARSLENVFVDGKPITLETGRKLADWAKGVIPPAAAKPAPAADLNDFVVTLGNGDVLSFGSVADLVSWYRTNLPKVKDAAQLGAFVQRNNPTLIKLKERGLADEVDDLLSIISDVQGMISGGGI
jgi:hypothetical protein